MFAADRSRAGWLTIVAGLALAGCSSLSLPLPGFAPPALPPSMEPGLVEASDPENTDRPSFFVQWKPGLPGLTQRLAIDTATALLVYPPDAVLN